MCTSANLYNLILLLVEVRFLSLCCYCICSMLSASVASAELDFTLRKANAVQAYREWMPIRDDSLNPVAINRTLQFGKHAALLYTLDCCAPCGYTHVLSYTLKQVSSHGVAATAS